MIAKCLFNFAIAFVATGFIGFVLGLRLLCSGNAYYLSRLETGVCYGIVIAWLLAFSYIVAHLTGATP